MAKRFNIGIDVDGVLSNFTHSARQLCKLLFDGRPDDSLVQTTWAFGSLGITPEEERKLWQEIDGIPNWWMTHDKLPGTDMLRLLNNYHRCIFITNRKDGTGLPIEQQTQLWIKQNFHIFDPVVVISDNKGPLGVGLKLDFFIDDRPKNCLEMISAAPSCKTCIKDATYNQECDVPRVADFDEFAKLIEWEAIR